MASYPSITCLSIIVLVLFGQPPHNEAQLSAPVAHDKNMHADGNKFLQRKASETADARGIEAAPFLRCPQNIQLRWMSEVSSSIYATPLITDLYSDGRKDIIVPTFVKTIEVVEAVDGAKALGWPASHGSTLHASPLLFDIDFDGVRDIVIATFNGEILFFKENGDRLPEAMLLPRLRVRKLWYKGLDLSMDDAHTHADIKDEEDTAFSRAHAQAVHQAEQHLDAAHGEQQGTTGHAGNAGQATPGQASSGQATTGQVDPRQATSGQATSGQATSGQASSGQATSGQVTSGQATSGQATSGQATSGQATSGQATSGQVTSGQVTSGQATSGQATSGQATSQTVQSVGQATGQATAGTNNSGTGSGGPGQGVGPTESEQLAAFLKTLDDYRSKYGEEAAKSVLENTKTVNPKLYAEVIRRQNTAANTPAQQSTPAAGSQRRLMSVEDEDDEDGLSGTGSRRRLMGADDAVGGRGSGSGTVAAPLLQGVEEEKGQELTQEAADSFHVFDDDYKGAFGDAGDFNADAGAQAQGVKEQDTPDDIQFDELGDILHDTSETQQFLKEKAAEEDADPNFTGHDTTDDLFRYDNLYQEDYHFKDPVGNWEESFEQKQHNQLDEFIMVDAHILCTPAIADIDQDGHEEIVISVSYFFEKEYYDNPDHASDPALKGLDLSKYVAGGIVVYDLRTRALRWSVHLDLSTEYTTYRAYIYSAPTLIDIDQDGKLEIMVGTSMGYIYILDHTGATVAGWPKQMGEVQGQVLAADFNNDGKVEIFASDAHGSIALWSSKGVEIAERHLKSMVSHRAMAADVNGDGELEIVFGTSGGKIYVVKGTNLDDLENFPFQTRGRILSPVLATRLDDGPSQQLVVMSFDGFLYLVDGMTACADTVDIGESSYSMVLADDLDNNKRMDLLVSTMNGNLYAFETPAVYHPLKTWTSEVLGSNNMVARHDYLGVYATAASREPRDVAGDKLQIKVDIVDKRYVFAPNGSLVAYQGGPYNVQVVLKGVGVSEMNSGPQPVIGVADTMQKPGSYILELPCPRTRTSATIHVELHDANRLYFVDEFSLSFNMHFHKLLKWMVALPLALMVVLLLGLKPTDDEPALPSYHLS